MVGWLLLVPTHPYLIIGPGAKILHQMPFALTSEWRIVYWQIIALMITQWPLKVMMVMPRFARIRQSLAVAVRILGILILTVLVQVRSFFVPTAALTTENLRALEGINTAINFGFRVVLIITVLKLAVDLWKLLSGAQQKQPGCVTVL